MLVQEEGDGDELVLQLDDGFQRLLAHGDSPASRLWKQEFCAVLLKLYLSYIWSLSSLLQTAVAVLVLQESAVKVGSTCRCM